MSDSNKNNAGDSKGRGSDARQHRPPRGWSSFTSPQKTAPDPDLVKIRAISDTSMDIEEHMISVPRHTPTKSNTNDLGLRNLSLSNTKGPKKRLNSFSEAPSRLQESPSARPFSARNLEGYEPTKNANDGNFPRFSGLSSYRRNIISQNVIVANPTSERFVFYEGEVTGGDSTPDALQQQHHSGLIKAPKRKRQSISSPLGQARRASPNAEVSLAEGSIASPEVHSTQSPLKEEEIDKRDDENLGEIYIQTIIKEPDARPISEDQLAAEVKGIYAGLVMVEAKCVNVVATQTLALQDSIQSGSSVTLHSDHWQALIALHRTLLHEHHDFFLASQHPSASHALRELASRYSMPARMWKHGIHSFLELLRRRLPESLEFMVTFIYLSYQMIALLYETVPYFEETWVECLGDLSRYRMAIEEADMKDREVWTATARFWYSKASDINPGTGRLQHHLAILARTSPIQQLCLYGRSLCSEQPFAAGRDSILTILEPVMGAEDGSNTRLASAEFSFIKLHGILFTGQGSDLYEMAMTTFLRQIDVHIGRVTTKWKLPGAYFAISNICATLKYGTEESPIWTILSEQVTSEEFQVEERLSSLDSNDKHSLYRELWLFNKTFSLVLNRVGDRNVLPFVHVTLVFLVRISTVAYDMYFFNKGVPWIELASFLNSFAKLSQFPQHVEQGESESLLDTQQSILPEDYAMRGQVWTTEYFPKTWFADASMDHDERFMEFQSNATFRTERVLGLGVILASVSVPKSLEVRLLQF